MGLLGVRAAVDNIGVRESRGPHHDSAESGIRLVLGNKGSELRGLKVVLSAALGSSGSERRGWDTDEELSGAGGGVGNVGLPVAKVDVGVVDGAAGVVVELDEEVVELAGGDDAVHVGLWDWALGSTGDVVSLRCVLAEVVAELRDHVLVVVVSGGGLDVEVEAVNSDIAEGTRGAATGRLAVAVPEVLANGLGLLLRAERVTA